MRRLRARILLFLFSALSLTLLLGLPKDDAPVVGVGLARQPAAKWSAGAAENATTSLALAKAAARGPVTSIAFLPEVYLMQTGNNKVPEVPCANVATVNGLVHTCCEGPSLGRGSRAAGRGVCCLPSIIVGGTQKSGSTAMSALLLQHPNVRFADRKEVHFFSMARSFTRGLDNYMSHFSVRRMPGTEQRLDHFVTAEATPFYLHSPDACRFISYTVPSAKLIFILRDPTARAYSEYQMKVRRIEEGATLSSAMQQHRGPFLSCLARFGLVDTMQFIECLPEAITSAAKWKGNAKRVLQRMGLIARPRKQPAAPSPIEELPPGEAPPLLSFTPEEKTDLGTLASLTARCFRHVGGQRLGEAELTAIIKNPAAGPRRRLGLNASADEEGMELPRTAPA